VDNTYYCEVTFEHSSRYPPGIYTFSDDGRQMGWITRSRLIQISNSVCKETEDGVFWVKNRFTGSSVPRTLSQDELKQFMWTKLKAQNI
jgi:hypothetical protein